MEPAKELLRFEFNAESFTHLALRPIEVNQQIRDILKKIVNDYGGEKVEGDPESRSQIYAQFISCPPRKLPEVFNTPSRVRRLAQVLTYSEYEPPRIIDTQQLNYVLQLIETHFSISAMLGVFNALLEVWNTANASMLRAFVKRHLIDYNGVRKEVQRLRANIVWYCEPNGPAQLAVELLRSGTKLSDVWSYLKLPDRTHGYRYFGAVAEAFVMYNRHLKQTGMMEMLEDIVNFFTKHNNEETNRSVLPKLIKRLGRNVIEDLRRPIQDYVLQKWQDPRIANASVHWHGVPDETWRIFMRWIMKEDLRFFYDVIVKRSRRRDFWLLYFGKVASCRIVLGRNAEILFGKDPYYQKQKESMARLKGSDRNQCVFIIKMGNQTFVECSTADVCYVYDNADFPYDLSKSEYYIQELVDKSRVKDCVTYSESASVDWREKLDSLIDSEAGIELLPISQLGKW